jgi:hypothetical protein
MRTIIKTLWLAISALIVVAGGHATAPLLAQQETKPVPKDSVRVSLPGCTKGYAFTAARRTTDEPGSFEIPEGMHLRMNGPKDMMKDIKAHEGSRIELTGLMKKGQFREGVNIGGGVRIMPGASPSGGSMIGNPTAYQVQIDVESWRPIVGDCPSK